MNQTYSKPQVIETGKNLVEFLIDICNTANNISGFLKEYISLLTSETGIYHKQDEALGEYAKSSAQTQQEADKMMDTSQQNNLALQDICQEFKEMNDKISTAQKDRETMDKKVKDLNAQINEITSFIKNIQEVSERTNLLSFNASIEAARAGEAGKGFRIIANEVKNLSAQTKELSNNIATAVRVLHEDVSAVVKENHEHDRFMDSLQQTAVSSSEKLVKIQNDNRENTQFMEHVLNQINDNQRAVLAATKEAENSNLNQIKVIASRAAENTIHTGDQLSFLFELRKLFNWLERNHE